MSYDGPDEDEPTSAGQTDPKSGLLPPTQSPPAPPTTGDDGHKNCERCGTRMESDEKKCPKCGYINSAKD